MATDLAFNYMINGNWYNYFVYLLNSYMPYGLFFWIIGFMFFLILHRKTQNLAFSAAFGSVYFIAISESGLVINTFANLAMKYFGIMLGAIVGYYVYRLIRS